MDYINEILIKDVISKVVHDDNKELEQRFVDCGKSIEREITESCTNSIESINKITENLLTIPDNVVLYKDKNRAKSISMEEFEALEKECDGLTKIFFEVCNINIKIIKEMSN
jgi:hypothetical protein